MKQLSIERILKNTTHLILLLMFMLAAVGLVLMNERISQKQIKLLQTQRSQVNAIANITPSDATFAMIKFQGIRSDMALTLDHLQSNLDSFNPLEPILPDPHDAKDLIVLKTLNNTFNEAAKQYISATDTPDDTLKSTMLQAHQNLLNHITKMIDATVAYEHRQFLLRELIIYAVIIAGIALFFWTHIRFKLIITDIQSLYGIDTKEYKIQTLEVLTIASRFKKEGCTQDNPAYIDSLTDLKNYKGLLHAYNNNKAMRSNNALCICVFEIDQFELMRQRYSQKFIDAVVKKVAFMMSLYEQHNDAIARLEDSKFVLLLPRNSKAEGLEECENIRKAVSEAVFKASQQERVNVTISGGFLAKPDTKTIDAAITHTKDMLKKAQEKGSNHIAQLRDYV